LEKKAKAIGKETNTDHQTVIKQIIKREKQREAARRIKLTLHKIRKGGVTKVEVELENGDIDEITTKQGIEEACMEENKKKFKQTEQTPCMQEPLRQLLGKFGDTESCQQILQGQFVPPPNTPIFTRELLAQLKQETPINDSRPSLYLSKTDFQEGWKKMSEYTSAGISGLHFGHMKACSTSDFASNFESSLAHIPYFTGYTPRDWSVGVNVMIQKKDRVNLVSKLRTITLTEADFNFNNKLLGKNTLAHAEVQNYIAKEQYGSRKGKSALEHAVHKRLTFDIMRQLRTNGALCSNDAKSCYDRILHSVASLAYQRLGIPKPPVKCMLQSIQNMKHHIRTSYGDSSFTMSNDGSLVPFQGALQGNGASPATWVIISTPLLNMLRSAGNGGHFIKAISKQYSHSVGYAFVDDTDLIQFDARDQKMSEEEVLGKMQQAINRWEGGLKATGGAIVPQKSFVYPIIFEFDEGGKWSYKKVEDIKFQFSVKDHNDEVQQLDQLDASVGRCTLGVHLAPDGNNNDAKRFLRHKAEEWSEYINAGHLNRQDAWLATESTILKSLLYPLALLTLMEKECNHIIAPVLESGLRSSSICKNFPRAVAYGPRNEGGLQLPNLYVQHGLARISLIVDNIGENNMMGELLRNTIEAAKVEIGVGRNIFSLDFDLYKHILTDSWIKSTWQFAQENGIDIIDKITRNLYLHRHNDVFLMEIIANHGFNKPDLQKINMCRLHLQVSTLSDISCGYGNKYNKAYNCEFDHTIPHQYLWPIQPRPSQSAIKVWRRALRLCFKRTNGIMDYTLGRWLYQPSLEWKWFFSNQTQLLYQRHRMLWRIWRCSSRAGNLGLTPRFTYDTNGLHHPINCVRATINRIDANYLIMTGCCYPHHTEVNIQSH
jgi:predicted lipid carrier protein YhbT